MAATDVLHLRSLCMGAGFKTREVKVRSPARKSRTRETDRPVGTPCPAASHALLILGGVPDLGGAGRWTAASRTRGGRCFRRRPPAWPPLVQSRPRPATPLLRRERRLERGRRPRASSPKTSSPAEHSHLRSWRMWCEVGGRCAMVWRLAGRCRFK